MGWVNQENLNGLIRKATPLKGDTPRSIYMDTVTFWYSKKAVEIEPRHI
jgi:hypothetical protein